MDLRFDETWMVRAKITLNAVDSMHTAEGAVSAKSTYPKSRSRSTESVTPPRIWPPSTADRSSAVDLSLSWLWKNPLYLTQGFSRSPQLASHSTGHGMEATEQQQPDPLTNIQKQPNNELLTEHKGKEITNWTVKSADASNPSWLPFETPRMYPETGKKAINAEGGHANPRSAIDPPDPENKQTNQGWVKADPTNLKQIFIRSVDDKHYCVQSKEGMDVLELKKQIQEKLGIPISYQNLIFSGHCMQDLHTLQHYGVANDSTIILNLRLRGGCKGTTSKNTGSFRDAVKGKAPLQHKPTPTTELPGPYIMEQRPESPMLTVSMPEVTNLYTDLMHNAVICRFNGYWPKDDALHQWVFSSWTPKCEIYLCPKGFFIARFSTELERDSIINQGPWFWGNAGLFITPWFSDFDANKTVVSTMPVWVRLHNLPLHFWHRKALTAIGNSIRKHLKIDEDRANRGIFTYARICVEVDLSQGLPDHITINFNNSLWTQQLDYENTTFRCRSCLQTGHLQYACPLCSKEPKGNKKQQKKPKGWQQTEPLEEEALNTEPTDLQGSQEKAMEENNEEPKLEPINSERQQDLQLEISGAKRAHSPEGSDSDKEQSVYAGENQLALIVPTPNVGVWRKVEKKKGRKI